MIQLYSGELCVLGLTAENIKRLTAGKPIHWTPVKPVTSDVMIIFGVDKPAILAELEAAGMHFPEAIKQSAQDDPL